MMQDTIQGAISDIALVEELDRARRLGPSLQNPYDREILDCYVAELEARLAAIMDSRARRDRAPEAA